MIITSSAFRHNQRIPKKYTCQGENINPPLNFADFAESTVQLALIMEDPDAILKPNFTHWVVYDIDPSMPKIVENHIFPSDINQGKNDFNEIGYSGPCPSSGTHRYIFKLFSLDEDLDMALGAEKEDLLLRMDGHILETAELIGLYNKDWP